MRRQFLMSEDLLGRLEARRHALEALLRLVQDLRIGV